MDVRRFEYPKSQTVGKRYAPCAHCGKEIVPPVIRVSREEAGTRLYDAKCWELIRRR